MSCLGGTVEEPRPWFHYRTDGTFVRIDGRWCNRTSPRTSRRKCSSCPAFRGIRWDGVIANGMMDPETPGGLSFTEHEAYQAAIEAAFDDDFLLVRAFQSRMEREVVRGRDGKRNVIGGVGLTGMRRIGDPEALEREAARMREYRAGHPAYRLQDNRRKRKRSRAAYMRAYRARVET